MIGCFVMCIDLAPVTGEVTSEKDPNALVRLLKGFKSAGGCADFAWIEERPFQIYHFVTLAV